jgi:hypothetical protein
MICTKGDGNKMTCLNDLGRRSFLKSAAVLGGATTLGAVPNTTLINRMIRSDRLTLQP